MRKLLSSGSWILAVLVGAPAAGQVFTRENSNGVVEATNIPGQSGYRLTYPGKGTLIHSHRFTGSYSGEYDPAIEDAAALHQVSPALVKAVIKVESAFDQWAVSSKGAQGLMQLMPFTARRFGVSDPFNARQNIFAGARYLRILLEGGLKRAQSSTRPGSSPQGTRPAAVGQRAPEAAPLVGAVAILC